MSLFSKISNKESYLGIDIGSASLKVVELKNESGRPRLMTYGFAEEQIDIIHDFSETMENKIVSMLTKVCDDSKTTSKKVVAALPSFSVFSSIISLPAMNKKELAKAIYWQAKKFVPLPLEKMTLDWKLLDDDVWVSEKNGLSVEKKPSKNIESLSIDKTKNSPDKTSNEDKKDKKQKLKKDKKDKKNLKVLIAAAPKKLVMRYVNIFKKAELDLLSLETENFALERSLVGGDKSPVMIVDIGDVSSDISIVENSIPILNRSVDVGGRAITIAIMNSMNIDQKRAEQFKRDIGFLSGQEKLPSVIETVIVPIINEIKYCFDHYASGKSQQRVEKIILTGGSAFLPKIDKYLSGLLNIKVIIGDPWTHIIYPIELKPTLNELAPSFAVSVGLAMREVV